MRGSGGSRAVLVTRQEPCNVENRPHPVTIADVGMEEWLEAPTPCDQDGQLTLDLSGPEQGPFEPMPPCMEFFKVKRLSVVMRYLMIAITSLCLMMTQPFPYCAHLDLDLQNCLNQSNI